LIFFFIYPVFGKKGFELSYQNYKPEFYSYNSDFNWVVFNQLFENKLPKEFPDFCYSLKQELNRKANSMTTMEITNTVFGNDYMRHDVYKQVDKRLITKVGSLKDNKDYPKQTDMPTSLSKAKFNKELYKFLKTL
jgi:hypothetical protein